MGWTRPVRVVLAPAIAMLGVAVLVGPGDGLAGAAALPGGAVQGAGRAEWTREGALPAGGGRLNGVAAASVPRDLRGGNLLVNPGFEDGFDFHGASELSVGAGWWPWFDEAKVRPEYKGEAYERLRADGSIEAVSLRVFHGAVVQKLFSTASVHDAGLYQQVRVPFGARLRFEAWALSWSSDCDDPCLSPLSPCRPGNPNSHGTYHVRVGIDPSGAVPDRLGASPPPGVAWSRDVVFEAYRDWHRLTAEATALGEVVTVYVRAAPEWPVKHNDSYWDDARLEIADALPTPATATAAGPTQGAATSTASRPAPTTPPPTTPPPTALPATALPATASQTATPATPPGHTATAVGSPTGPWPATTVPPTGAATIATPPAPGSPQPSMSPSPPIGPSARAAYLPLAFAVGQGPAATAGHASPSPVTTASPAPSAGVTATSSAGVTATSPVAPTAAGPSTSTRAPATAPATVAPTVPPTGTAATATAGDTETPPSGTPGPSGTAGSSATPMLTPIATPCVAPIANGDFEQGDTAGWKIGPDGPAHPALRADPPVGGGEHALQVGVGTPHLDLGPTWSYAVQSFALPPDIVTATVRFDLRPMSQEPGTGDFQMVALRDFEGSPAALLYWRPGAASPGWTTFSVPLAPAEVAGRTMRIAFEVFNDGDGGPSSLLIDNVAVVACRAPGGNAMADAPVPPFADIRIDFPIRYHPTQPNFLLNSTCDELAFEALVVRNHGTVSVDTGGWTLADRSGAAFTFPPVVLEPGERARVWTRSGDAVTDGAFTDLYWGRPGPAWDNDGDEAVIRDDAGTEVARRGYP